MLKGGILCLQSNFMGDCTFLLKLAAIYCYQQSKENTALSALANVNKMGIGMRIIFIDLRHILTTDDLNKVHNNITCVAQN